MPLPVSGKGWFFVQSEAKMGVRKRGTQYYAQVESDGERKYATFPTKAMANAWILQEKSAFARNKGEPKSDRSITLRTVLERYVKEHLPKNKSGEVDALRLNAFINSCKFIDTAVVDLKASDFVAWRDQRLKLRASSTVARDLNCIRAALNLAPGGTDNRGGKRRQIRLSDLVWNMGAGWHSHRRG